MISVISLSDDRLSHYSAVDLCPRVVTGLNRVNIFVGKNNCGKSRLLAGLFGGAKFDYIDQVTPLPMTLRKWIESTGGLNEALMGPLQETCRTSGEWGQNEEVIEFNEAQRAVADLLDEAVPIPFDAIVRFFVAANAFSDFFGSSRNDFVVVTTRLRRCLGDGSPSAVITFHETLLNAAMKHQPQLRRFFIPVLRSPKLIGMGDPTTSTDQVMRHFFDDNHHSSNTDIRSRIYTGSTLYNDLDNSRNNGQSAERERLEEFQRYFSATFLDGEKIQIVPSRGNGTPISVKIGEAKDRAIFHLGDGLQHLILITFALWCKYDRGIVFLEEPELFMHPGMVRSLLESLLSEPRFESYQFFISTHSNHIIDRAVETDKMSVYKVTRRIAAQHESFAIARSLVSDMDILADLGVRASSVMLSNCTIWVEGITDRLYLSHILTLTKTTQYVEGVHYSFVEYGGSAIVHHHFGPGNIEGKIAALAVSRNILVITDNYENQGDALQKRRKEIESALGDRYIDLECREIENILSWKVIKEILQEDKEDVDGEYEYSDYKNVYLGGFIEDTVLRGKGKRKWASRTETGSALPIKYKLPFCRKAIAKMTSSAALTEYAKFIGEKTLKFIEASNR